MLDIHSISFSYGTTKVLDQISLQIPQGELTAILGGSGCGKTSLLRIISGFEQPTNGYIKLDEQTLCSADVLVPPQKRKIGLMFQEPTLFSHLSVEQNVAFGLHELSKTDRYTRVQESLDLVQMMPYKDRFPHQLSGGQQQRIALARALAPRPKLLLLDEPFSSLDSQIRDTLYKDLKQLLNSLNITTILVTHLQSEAFLLADQIGVMHDGQIVQWGAPESLYMTPKNRFVAEFIGDGCCVDVTVKEKTQIDFENQKFHCNLPEWTKPGDTVKLILRPHQVVIDTVAPQIKARILSRTFSGDKYIYTLQLPSGIEIICHSPLHSTFNVTDTIGISLRLDHAIITS